MTLRRALDRLYDGAGWLAALFLIGTLVFVLIGISGRLLHFHLPGTDAYAGYCMAACGFLALAYTFRRGEHIRVTLVLEHLGPGPRRAMERIALALAVLFAGLFAFYSVRLAWQSFDFNDVSTATDATPLWIPQLAMAFGTLVFLVAIIDAFVDELAGRRNHAVAGAPLHNE